MKQESLNDLKKKFIGLWKLISYDIRSSSGESTYPLGKEGHKGLILYDECGYMSAQIMRPERPKFAIEDQMKGTPEEIKAAYEGFVSYYGPYEIDSKKGTVIHHVEASLYPNWIGKDQVRFFEFSGSSDLTLKTPPMQIGGEEFVSTITWTRIR